MENQAREAKLLDAKSKKSLFERMGLRESPQPISQVILSKPIVEVKVYNPRFKNLDRERWD